MSFDTLCPPAAEGARAWASCEARRGVSGAVVFYQHDSRPKLVIRDIIALDFLSFFSASLLTPGFLEVMTKR
jgi:hypothetical protein